jgi:signal transduction histidine kinase
MLYRVWAGSASPGGRGPGRANERGVAGLAWRLAGVFLAVALMAIVVLAVLTQVNGQRNIRALATRQQTGLARSAAVAAGASFAPRRLRWAAALKPLLDLVTREGAGARVRDHGGGVVAVTPGFGALPARSQQAVPVLSHERRVGSLELRFAGNGLDDLVSRFTSERIRTSITAAAIVALLALAVSLLVSRWITLPLERVLLAIRARGAGDRTARAGSTKGTAVMREVAAALDESSDAIDDRDRTQRNMVASVAHELRTPVAVVQATVEAMMDGITDPTREGLSSLRDETLRLARRIDRLEQLAAAEAAALRLNLAPCDLAAIAGSTAARLSEPFAAAGVRLACYLDPARYCATRPGCAISSPTCSPTPSSTPRPAGQSACEPARCPAATARSPWPTPASASRPANSPKSPSGSTGAGKPPPWPPARASGWPSSPG